jgi:hypothetical protein
MSFKNHVFSTTTSIAKIDNNINSLSNKMIIYVLDASSTDIAITVPTGTTKATVIDTNGSTTVLTPVGSVITLTELKAVSIFCQDAEDEPVANYLCDVGQGSTLIDELGNGVAAIIDGPIWSKQETLVSWQSKIDIAKSNISTKIIHYLKNDFLYPSQLKFYEYCTTYKTTQTELLNMVTNLDILNLASDYLTLAMINDDLSKGGQNSMYYDRGRRFKVLYDEQMSDNMGLLNLDLNDDGTADIIAHDVVNEILN